MIAARLRYPWGRMPEWNPYKPPSADTSPSAAGVVTDEGFVPPRTGWARAAVGGLVACIVIGVLSLWAEMGQVQVLNTIRSGTFDMAVVEASDLTVWISAILELVAVIFTAVCFLKWMAGANRTARSLAPNLISDTPNWSVGWWFIPFANLYKPYAGLKEIWHASTVQPGTPYQANPPSVFPIWWTFWIVRIVLSRVAQSMATSAGTDAGHLISATYAQMTVEVVSIVAAASAIVVVRSIAGAQEKLARSAA